MNGSAMGEQRRDHRPTAAPPPPRRRAAHRSRRFHPLALLAIAFAVLSSALTLSNLAGSLRTTSSSSSRVDVDDPSFSPPPAEPTKPTIVQERFRRERSSSDRFRIPPLGTNATGSKRTRAGGGSGRGGTAQSNGTEENGDAAAGRDGLHACTCLNDGDPRNSDLPPDPPNRIRWLHIPKTGTSFVSTLWSYAASSRDRYIDLNISSIVCGMHDNKSYSMYDFALMRRYPWEVYGARNMIPKSTSGPISRETTPFGLVGGTQHIPIAPNLKDRQFVLSKHFQRVRHKTLRGGSEIFDHNITVASFFRQPEERIVSAYYDSRHSSGFAGETWKELIRASHQRGPRHTCAIDGVMYNNPLLCFARFPGIAGCMARMLAGERCADGILQESGLENLPYAFDIIMNHLDFVGLTEDWNESICQFHRLFMGKLDKSTGKRHWDPPLQGEFSNVHKSIRDKHLGVDYLAGYKDLADTVVYEAVKIKFDRMVGGKRCYKYMTRDELKERKQSDDGGGGLPFLKIDEGGHVCEPKSCSDLGKQCGEWDDGCGRTIICGMCNVGRTGLPSTWRVQCVEGQCVDYCPPWDEKGYWFLSEDSPSVVRNLIQKQDARHRKFLSPVDAVEICRLACADGDGGARPEGIELFANNGMCRCGAIPSILEANLTLDDFSAAHDMTVMCKDTKARKEAVLNETETQPACCAYLPPTVDTIPTGWKRLYTIGGLNLEGEYFEHVRLGCGSFRKCKSVALRKRAEMAVFDVFNSMCYLARNVVDLGDVFTVTKDNHYRYMIDLRRTAAKVVGQTNAATAGRTEKRITLSEHKAKQAARRKTTTTTTTAAASTTSTAAASTTTTATATATATKL